MTFKNVKHITILTLLAVLFLFSAPSLVPVPSISNSLQNIFLSSEKIPADAQVKEVILG